VELFERIRRDHRDEGLSVRALAERYHVHRRTVRAALANATPPVRKTPVRDSPVMGPYAQTVRGWLEDDQKAPRKQRHTARRVWQRLVAEEGAQVAESTVRAFVARTRAEMSAGREVVVPQTHLPGAEAEADFGEFYCQVAGVVTRLYMFVMRLSFSGRAIHIAYGNAAAESFLDGHVRAFARFGGVPGRIRYDNLKPAVLKVLLGRERLENPRFIALRSHYGFDSFYCRPGVEGAHEKGGVEGEVGRFRRAHLVPPPAAADLAGLNAAMADADAAEDARVITGRELCVGAAAAAELPALAALPADPFEVSTLLSARVDTKARICVRQAYYSVPARLSGRRVAVRLGAAELAVYDGTTRVATHPRSLHRHTETLELDHYLEVLVRKPGALAGSTALAAARASGAFTATHQRFWDAARRAHGDAAGTRALVGVLLLHRTLPAAAVAAGTRAALAAGRPEADLAAIEARRYLEATRTTPAAHPAPAAGVAGPGQAGTVTPASAAPGFHRATPTLSGYDALLDSGDLR
jgi:transposase